MSFVCRDIAKTYRGPHGLRVEALRGFSLEVDSGQLALVKGPSGSGKTTLLAILAGLLAPDRGTIVSHGVEVTALSPWQLAAWRRAHVGFVLQTFPLIPYLNVLENVLLTARMAGKSRDEALQALEFLQMTHRLAHLPDRLSVGERQRTAVARALAPEPAVVLADEPTANLDEANSQLVFRALQRRRDAGGVVVVATHSRQADAMADLQVDLQAEADLVGNRP